MALAARRADGSGAKLANAGVPSVEFHDRRPRRRRPRHLRAAPLDRLYFTGLEANDDVRSFEEPSVMSDDNGATVFALHEDIADGRRRFGVERARRLI